MRPGEVVAGKWIVEAAVARGGMAQVFRGFDRDAGVPVAIKVLDPMPEGDARVARELDAMARVRHPSVVSLLAHDRVSDGRRCLVLEWIEGVDLARKLAAGPLPTVDVLRLGVAVAGALAAVHETGVVHRDLKPGNVLLPGGDVGRAKLADFGIAFLRDAAPLTRTGFLVGTPGYMAPEQIRGARDLDGRADLFSLGAVLYRALSGRRPFAGDRAAVLAKVLFDGPDPLDDVAAPAALRAAILQLLARDRDARPATADEVLRTFDALLAPDTQPMPSARAPEALGAAGATLACVVAVRALGAKPLATARSLVTEGAVELLDEQRLVVVLQGDAHARDRAVSAARLAASMLRVPGVLGASVAMGNASSSAVGEAIDAALAGLHDTSQRVRLDATTAGLLGGDLTELSERVGAVFAMDEGTTRTLAPFVGRGFELRLLGDLFDEVASIPAARVALVHGPPGYGKSRLRAEFARALRARGVHAWIARGDPGAAGAPLSLAGEALRAAAGAAGARDAGAVEAFWRTQGADAQLAELAVELAAGPLPDARASASLRALRRDAAALGERLRTGFAELVALAARRAPVALVLEDLQWADFASLRAVAAAVRESEALPLFVLALARSDVELAAFDELPLQRIALRPLPPRAAEELVTRMLPAAEPRAVRGIVDAAEGSPLLLEELARARADADVATAPRSALALVRARLERLGPDARRVARVASVLGVEVDEAALRAMLAGADVALESALDELASHELLVRVGTALVFRHDLLREAAYASLTDGDRIVAHRRAAELATRLAPDQPSRAAEHLERAGDAAAAAPSWADAALRALAADDVDGALRFVERGSRGAADDAVRGRLARAAAEALTWLGRYDEAAREAREAMSRLAAGSSDWWAAATWAIVAAGRKGDAKGLRALASELLSAPSSTEASLERTTALARAASALAFVDTAAADSLLGALEDVDDPLVAARVEEARANRAMATGAAELYADRMAIVADRMRSAGAHRAAILCDVNRGYALVGVGRAADAAEVLAAARDAADARRLPFPAAAARHNLGLALLHLGRLDEALAAESAALQHALAHGDLRLAGASRTYLSRIHLAAARPEPALHEADAAVSELAAHDALRGLAHAAASRALLALSRIAEAIARAEEAVRLGRAQSAIEGSEREALEALEAARAAAARSP